MIAAAYEMGSVSVTPYSSDLTAREAVRQPFNQPGKHGRIRACGLPN
jgi:hypothetical protein